MTQFLITYYVRVLMLQELKISPSFNIYLLINKYMTVLFI
jgi:hypothetical protein